MSPDVFAEWLRLQGHCVVRTAGSYWSEEGPGIYQAFPYHWVIQPSEEEILEFLCRSKAIGLRYSTMLDFPIGLISYHVVYEGDSYDFDNLGKWARKNVRKGLKSCSVEPISFEYLADEGWALHMDTLDRQRRRGRLDRAAWHKLCLVAAGLPGFEAWGAMVAGRLAASLITFQMEDCCHMLYQQSLREYLQAHVNNALCFVVTRTMISRPTIRSIFYSLHSLDAPPSVDEFKFRMGYSAKPLRQRVVFRPWLAPFCNRFARATVGQLLRLAPGQSVLSKAEGLIRFHVEGRRPLNEQDWPQCLAYRKRELLESHNLGWADVEAGY